MNSFKGMNGEPKSFYDVPLSDETRDGLRDASPMVTEFQ